MDHHLTGQLHVSRAARRAAVVGLTAFGVAALGLVDAVGASAAASMPAPPDNPCGRSAASTVTTSATASGPWLLLAFLAGIVVTAGCVALARRFKTAGWPAARTRRLVDADADDPRFSTDLLARG